jgi:anti-anti-sigma factor
MPVQLSVSVRGEGGATVVRLRGELDLASHPEFEATLAEALGLLPERVVMDLAELEFMDVAGMRAILRSQERAEGAGKQLVLAAPVPGVRRLLSLTGQEEAFRTFDSVPEAIGADLR